MSLMKNLFGRKDLATKRDRRSRKAFLQRCRRALALEPLEGRALLSVSNVNITSITGLGDRDGNLSNEHVQVTAGTDVSVKFDYTTAGGTGGTNQHAEIWTSGFGSLMKTGVFNDVTDADGAHTGTVTVSTTGLAPGNYAVKVLVNHKGNGTDSDDNSVSIYSHVTPTVPLTALNTNYNGSVYNGASVSSFAGDSFGTTTLHYTGTSNVGDPYDSDVAPTNAGTYTVTASYVSDGNVHAFTQYDNSSNSVAFTIAKAKPTFAVTGYTGGTYDGTGHTQTVTVTGVGADGTLFTDSLSGTNAGGYSQDWSYSNGNYNDVSGTLAFDIAKADATVVVSGYTGGTYDGTGHTQTATVTGVGTDGVLFTQDLTKTNAGSYSQDWSYSNGNYNDVSGTLAFDIAKADATVAVSGYTGGTYDGGAHTQTVTVTGVGADGTLFTDSLSGTNAGTYSKDWSYSNGNYNDVSSTLTFSIAKADATVSSPVTTNVTYNGSEQSSGNATITGVNGEVLATAAAVGTNAGTYTATASITDNPNYKDANAVATLNIAKANAIIVVTGYTDTWNGVAHTATGSAKGVKGESLAGLDLSGTTHTGISNYTDTWTFTDTTGNYNDVVATTVTDTINAPTASLFSTSTQGSLNVGKNGKITTTLTAIYPLADSDTLAAMSSLTFRTTYTNSRGSVQLTPTVSSTNGILTVSLPDASALSSLVDPAVNTSSSTGIDTTMTLEVQIDGTWYTIGTKTTTLFTKA
jgi:hypothetical protein